MHIFKIEPTKKSEIWFVENKICIPAMSSALTLLYSEIEPVRRTSLKRIKIQILYNTNESRYFFRTNKLYIMSEPYLKDAPTTQKHIGFFNHFLHEFRHWMQSQIYKVGIKELSYTDQDVVENSNAYYRNTLEVDARQFERKYINKFYSYYVRFVKIYQ